MSGRGSQDVAKAKTLGVDRNEGRLERPCPLGGNFPQPLDVVRWLCLVLKQVCGPEFEVQAAWWGRLADLFTLGNGACTLLQVGMLTLRLQAAAQGAGTPCGGALTVMDERRGVASECEARHGSYNTVDGTLKRNKDYACRVWPRAQEARHIGFLARCRCSFFAGDPHP
eukprot:1159935-Pelagomonas_calceolata.AAC.3